MANISRRASERAAKAVGKVAASDIELAGVGGATFDPSTGQVSLTQDPRALENLRMLQELSGGQAAGAGQLAPGVTQFGQQAYDTSARLLEQAGTFDPLGEAEKRFQRLQGVLETARTRQRGSLESQLFAQGRLDSTGGWRDQAELERAFAAQDQAALDQYYSEAQAAQQQAVTQGLQAGAAGTTAQQSQFQQFLQALAPQEQVATAPLRLAGASQEIAATEAARRAGAAGALSQHNAAVAAADGGGSGLGSAIGGIAGAAIGTYLAPGVGTSAGATLGANLGSFL